MHKTIIGLLFLLGFQTAHAGAVSGGGGKGVICRDGDGSIRSAELLDLWEARTIYGREILRSDRPLKELVGEGIERLKLVQIRRTSSPFPGQAPTLPTGQDGSYLVAELERYTSLFLESSNYEKQAVRRLRGVTLSDTNDSFEIARPSSCAVEQIINYVDQASRPMVYINQDIYEALDNVNQAALILHEGLYKILRQDGERNSIRTRRAIGAVMAGETFTSTRKLLREERITCTSADFGTVFHLLSFMPHWETPRFPKRPIIGVFVEKAFGIPTMGFEKFHQGVGGDLADIFTEMFDPSRPISGVLPYNNLETPMSGFIEPELQSLVQIKGAIGELRKVKFTLQKRITGTTKLPKTVETTCELIAQERE